MSRGSSDRHSEILALRASIAATRVEVPLLRLQLAWKRYDPNQPRVPAGSPESGQWTDGTGAWGTIPGVRAGSTESRS